jgi:hypothetical protein
MQDRQEAIHEKGFKMGAMEYGALKIGKKNIEDIVYDVNIARNMSKNFTTKNNILKALKDNDLAALREISEYFYRTDGIYFRVCNYFAQMYRYDWCIVPEIYDKKVKEDNVISDFKKVLTYLDNSYIKKICADVALSVIKNGAYYGLVIPSKNGVVLQELPIEFCRCQYHVGAMPAIEMNMKFFDTKYSDVTYRLKVLKSFPEDV